MNRGLYGFLRGAFPAGTTDLARTATVTSNATGSTANLIDGNDTTSSSFSVVAIPSSTWTFDLGSVHLVTGWRVLQNGPGSGNWMGSYKWQWSNDASIWTDIVTRLTLGADDNASFPTPQRARYFRLVGLTAPNNAGAGWVGYTVSLFGF